MLVGVAWLVGGVAAGREAQRAHIPGVGPRETAGTVVRLTDATLGRVLGSGDAWFVKFYSPSCGHCRHMAPEWEALAVGVVAAGVDVKVGEVDGSRARSAARKHGVTGFPTLLYFDGDGRARKPYRGPRTADAMLKYLVRLGRPAVTEGTTYGEVVEFVETHAGSESDAVFLYLAGDGDGAAEGRGTRRVFASVAGMFREELTFVAAGADSRDVARWLGEDAVDVDRLPAVVAVHRSSVARARATEGTCGPPREGGDEASEEGGDGASGEGTCAAVPAENGDVDSLLRVTRVLYPVEAAEDVGGGRNVGKAMRDFVHVGRFEPLLQLSQATFGPLTRSEKRGRRIMVVILADDGTGEHSRELLAELEDVGRRVHEDLQVAWLPVGSFPAWQARFMGPKGANQRPCAFVYDYAGHKFYMDPGARNYTTGADVEKLAADVMEKRLQPYMAWERGLTPYDYVIFLTSSELLSAAVMRNPGFALFCITGPASFMFLAVSMGCCGRRRSRRPLGTPDPHDPTLRANLAVQIEARKREAMAKARREKRRARDRKIEELKAEIALAHRRGGEKGAGVGAGGGNENGSETAMKTE